jgi:two-component system NtrC family response regulator
MGEHARIIIVDDDEGIRETLTAILQEEGYRVDSAESGKEAIEKTRTGFYNLALIDVRLPDIEGIDLLKEIKETVPKIRKIIITGYPTLQNAVEAVNNGADAYVLKPFEIEKVLRIIKEQLEKQHDEKKYSQEKVTEFIETRVKELEKEKTGTHK